MTAPVSSRSLDHLHPALRPLAEKFVEGCKARGVDARIICTYRNRAEQARLYAQGRTAPGARVTNAKPGQSRHNDEVAGKPAATAFDACVFVAGKPEWNATHPHWQVLGEVGQGLGLEWAGTWKSFKEFPHFQLRERPADVARG